MKFEIRGIIPAIRNTKCIDKAIDSDHKVVFLLTGNVLDIQTLVGKVKKNGKRVLVDIDLIKGIAGDEWGIRYLKDVVKVDGIISTKQSAIEIARKEDLMSVQRVFILDSQGLAKAITSTKNSHADYIEVLPAPVVFYICDELKRFKNILIAGGLVRTRETAKSILDKGIVAVTTSCTALWTEQMR